MEDLFEIRTLSEEQSIRLEQLSDLQEAREKVYHEFKIERNRGIIDYPHVTIEDLIRAPFESTSAPGPELVKEENTRVLENGSALAGYLFDNDREKPITSIEQIASVVDQSSAAVDQKGTFRVNINEKLPDVNEYAFFHPILVTGDNSVTAVKVSKKPSVAARLGKWLRSLHQHLPQEDPQDPLARQDLKRRMMEKNKAAAS
ncbi:hypothetical protein DPMN_181855 [Dreissena polymorpha]|uniref:Uncharacterized protein n=1 Tax=Dreissena polymorpha TaxID=45954 RepID=A0A9D4I4T3_DREPO|nr:hypothetical protein DPMN_181855 [Dreissena polymorpha]